MYLDKITFRTGEVKFNYLNDRLDIPNDIRLTDIKIFSKNEKDILSLVKQWQLRYSYFEGTSNNGYESVTGELSKRLKLESVTENDLFGNSNPPFLFTYNVNDVYNPASLPLKTSYSRDHWGYYNGKSNSSLIPDFQTQSTPYDPVASYIGVQGENRNTDPRYSQLFSLKEIKYPTGGRTVFEFESNDFDLTASKVNDRTDLGSVDEAVNKVASVSYTDPIGTVPTTFNLQSNLMDLTSLYVAPNQTAVQVELTAYYNFTSGVIMQDCNLSENQIVYMALISETGAIMGESYLENLNQTFKPFTDCSGTGMTFYQNYTLAPGKYYWKIKLPQGYTKLLYVKVNIKFKGFKNKETIPYETTILSNASFGGGLRIKKISTYDNITTVPEVKNYRYHTIKEDGTHISNGRRMARPMYSYFDDSWGTVENQFQTTYYRFEHLIRESDSNIPLNGSAGGSVVGYDTVRIYYGEDGKNGMTEYAFENIPDKIWNYSESGQINTYAANVPRKPPVFSTCSNPGNGNIKRQVDYEKTNGIFMPVKQVVNTYEELLGNVYPVWYGIEKRNYNGPSLASCPFRAYIYPTLVEERKLLTSTKVTLYDRSDATKKLTQQIDYTYNNNTHLQLISTKQTNSASDQITTSYTYPLDYTDAASDAAILQMKNNFFMHQNPITQNTSIKKSGSSTSLLLNSTIHKFQYLNNKITLKEIAALETTAPIVAPSYQPSGPYPVNYTTKIQFDSYDGFGNILQMHKVKDANESYIWGYNSTYPIAKVLNSTISSIAYTSFESNSKGNWNFTGASLADYNPVTGNKSYDLSAGPITKGSLSTSTTYIVSYWGRSGPQSVNGVSPSVTGISVNGWVYYKYKITNASTVTVSGSGVIDELRLYPADAQMITYTYDPLVGMTSQCSANNDISYYEYDALGRLKVIRDQNRYVLKKYCYNYAGQPQSCSAPSVQVTVKSLNPNGRSGYTAKYTNVNTGVSTTYNISTDTSKTMGSLPSGNYNLTIANINDTTIRTFGPGCNSLSTDGPNATFYNITISSLVCDKISIN